MEGLTDDLRLQRFMLLCFHTADTQMSKEPACVCETVWQGRVVGIVNQPTRTESEKRCL